MSVVLTETGGDSHSDEGASSASRGGYQSQMISEFSSICEIEEEEEEEEEEIMMSGSEVLEIKSRSVAMPSIKEEIDQASSLFSFNFHDGDDDVIYVAVGKAESSLDALLWTLSHAVNPSTLVFLIHVFPELRYIPTPLGKLPVNQVNPEQKENHMIQERSKRREFLQKFLDACSASKVKVDTILIESDMEAKALLDLIPILNIRKMVLGTTKSNLRKLRSKKGSGIADQLLQNAPEFCEVKIICEGKEVVDYVIESPSPRGGSHVDSPLRAPPEQQQEDQSNDSFGCTCFRRKVMA